MNPRLPRFARGKFTLKNPEKYVGLNINWLIHGGKNKSLANNFCKYINQIDNLKLELSGAVGAVLRRAHFVVSMLNILTYMIIYK